LVNQPLALIIDVLNFVSYFIKNTISDEYDLGNQISKNLGKCGVFFRVCIFIALMLKIDLRDVRRISETKLEKTRR
jgi:hypothetical protein